MFSRARKSFAICLAMIVLEKAIADRLHVLCTGCVYCIFVYRGVQKINLFTSAADPGFREGGGGGGGGRGLSASGPIRKAGG